ncbi:conserved hypothetical protein [Mesorhizobium delmotii]|uniref:Uncharacterized protein n=1 Tax=Mesorhizobium delmotii TaxID=1631247 RepID=A0A2P9ALD3_9HYPH|nr:conserved hypothetical protein [Mesorhizobium delmotii]
MAQYRCACFITELDLATADHDFTGIPELARCGASGDLQYVSLPSPQSFPDDAPGAQSRWMLAGTDASERPRSAIRSIPRSIGARLACQQNRRTTPPWFQPKIRSA